METFLEIRGKEFKVAGALRKSPLRPRAKLWRRGQKFGAKRRYAFKDSGVAVWIGGDAEAGLKTQMADVIQFLREEAAEIRRLRSWPGVTRAYVRFGDLWNPAAMVGRVSIFPSEVLLRCGELRLEIVLCQYLTSDG